MIVPLLSYLQITVQIFYLFMFRLLFHKILMGLFSMKGWSGEEVKIEVTDIGKGDSPAGSHNIHISSKFSYDAGCLPNFRNRIPTHFLDFSCLVSNFSWLAFNSVIYPFNDIIYKHLLLFFTISEICCIERSFLISLKFNSNSLTFQGMSEFPVFSDVTDILWWSKKQQSNEILKRFLRYRQTLVRAKRGGGGGKTL